MWDKYELIQSRLALICSRLNASRSLPSCRHSAVFAQLCQVVTLLFLPRAGRGEWYEKTSLSNGDEVAGMSQWPAGAGAQGLEESRNLKSHICNALKFRCLLLPPFRWSRMGFQIVTVLMWLKDVFCAKFLFVQLISSINATLNPIGHCHLSFLYFDATGTGAFMSGC